MANKFRQYQGLEANRLAETPLSGELLWTTDTKVLWMGDGSTPGGIKVTKDNTDYVDLTSAQTAAGVKTWSDDAIFNGDVGIGTASPEAGLHVVNDLSTIYLERNILSTAAPNQRFRKSRGTHTVPTQVQALDQLGNINFAGYLATGWSTGVASIRVYAEEIFTDTSAPTYMIFETTSSGSVSDLERVRIDSAGNVGIGTTSPDAKTVIVHSALTKSWTPDSYTALAIESATYGSLSLRTGTTGYIKFGDADSENSGEITYRHTDDVMWFKTNSTEQMRIDSAGNVGIGNTPSGTYKLEVSGGIGATSFAGILSANLLSRIVGETVSGDWVFSSALALGANLVMTAATGADFYLGQNAVDKPIIAFDGNDYLEYDATANTYNFVIGGSSQLEISASAVDLKDNDVYTTSFMAASAFLTDYCELSINSATNMGGVAGTITYVAWDGTEVHKDTSFTHSTVTNPSRITVTTAGRYEVKCVVGLDNTGANRFSVISSYRINGTTAVLTGRQKAYSRGALYGKRASVGLDIEMDLSASDYIEIAVEVEQTDATYTVNSIVAETQFIMRRIG